MYYKALYSSLDYNININLSNLIYKRKKYITIVINIYMLTKCNFELKK